MWRSTRIRFRDRCRESGGGSGSMRSIRPSDGAAHVAERSQRDRDRSAASDSDAMRYVPTSPADTDPCPRAGAVIDILPAPVGRHRASAVDQEPRRQSSGLDWHRPRSRGSTAWRPLRFEIDAPEITLAPPAPIEHCSQMRPTRNARWRAPARRRVCAWALRRFFHARVDEHHPPQPKSIALVIGSPSVAPVPKSIHTRHAPSRTAGATAVDSSRSRPTTCQ